MREPGPPSSVTAPSLLYVLPPMCYSLIGKSCENALEEVLFGGDMITSASGRSRSWRCAITEKEHTPRRLEQAPVPRILVVANDPQLLKLLSMALSLEFACEVLTVDSARRAEEVSQRLTPTLVIIDEQLLDQDAQDLSVHLHRLGGLGQLPTLFLNVTTPSHAQRANHPYSTHFLGLSWRVEALYAAVQVLLGCVP